MSQPENQIETDEKQMSAQYPGSRKFYKNICDQDSVLLDEKINKQLEAGWTLLGQPYPVSSGNGKVIVCQCVIKKNPA